MVSCCLVCHLDSSSCLDYMAGYADSPLSAIVSVGTTIYTHDAAIRCSLPATIRLPTTKRETSSPRQTVVKGAVSADQHKHPASLIINVAEI
ncbi:MAG: hypothetical protein K6T99_12265 [Armatimonadetes bacterium]|nr:hypothetical protein [Armatimonadota bacterium]